MPTVKLLRATENPMELLKVSAGECYQKSVNDKVIEHIVDAGHLSVLEHCSATFEITCSITVLLQLTRHRHFSFTVQSSRGSQLNSYYEHEDPKIREAIRTLMYVYEKVCSESDTSYEDAAYLLPKGAEYKLVITGNFRTWFEYLPKRLCKRATKEHRDLAQRLLKELKTVCYEVFSKVKMNCENCKERGCDFA